MIRRGDQVRLSLRKLALRKKRAVFSIISVALGVIVVVAIDSLIQNVRDLIVRTNLTEDIDRDAIMVYAVENPYEFSGADRGERVDEKKRVQFLTESTFENLRAWPEVEAADHPVDVYPVGLGAFTNRPQPVMQLSGVPDAMVKRYAQSARLLATCTNAVPLVVGERNVGLRYDAKKKTFVLEKPDAVNEWIGREVTVVLGDNGTRIQRFQYDGQKKQWNERSKEDIEQRREAIQRNHQGQYDAAIMDTVLTLKGRIVGLCPGSRVLISLDTAVQCDKWITQRRELASLHPAPEVATAQYGVRGRQTPKSGEYNDGIVLVKQGVNAETVAERIRKLGFQAATRASAFEATVKDIDTGIRFVKRIALAFGGLILGIACGLLWSTTSRTVSDSRVDIGLFRALGATKSDIRRLFLSEAVMLGLLGTLVGMLVGWAVAFYISRWVLRLVRGEITDPEELVMLPGSVFSIDVRFCLTLLISAVAVSILAGLIPANRAAKVDPVKALKRE